MNKEDADTNMRVPVASGSGRMSAYSKGTIYII